MVEATVRHSRLASFIVSVWRWFHQHHRWSLRQFLTILIVSAPKLHSVFHSLGINKVLDLSTFRIWKRRKTWAGAWVTLRKISLFGDGLWSISMAVLLFAWAPCEIWIPLLYTSSIYHSYEHRRLLCCWVNTTIVIPAFFLVASGYQLHFWILPCWCPLNEKHRGQDQLLNDHSYNSALTNPFIPERL